MVLKGKELPSKTDMKRKVLENKGLNVNERLRVVANIDVFCIRIKL